MSEQRAQGARADEASAPGKLSEKLWVRHSAACLSGLVLSVCTVAQPIALRAQDAEQRGAAEISLVGFQASYSPATHMSTSGVAVSFSQYWPKLGLLEGSAEGFREQGALRTGTDFLRLSDLRWRGEKASATWGDFSVDPYPLRVPFLNIAVPRVEGNGFHLELTGKQHVYRIFAGRGSLLAGARIPLRYSSGQSVVGAEASWELKRNVSISGRVLDFGRQDPNAFRGIANGFGTNSQLPAALSAAGDVSWKPRRSLEVFAEASYSAFRGGKDDSSGTGGIVGMWWESGRWKAHTNYIRQPAAYLPVAGYIVNARSGYFADLSFQLHPRVGIYGSTNRQRLDLAVLPEILQYRQSSNAIGTTARLPWRVDLSAQYTDLVTRSSQYADQRGRFTTVSMAKALKRQTVRFTARQLSVVSAGSATRQNSVEFGDDVTIGRLTVSGASRWEREVAGSERGALYFRGGVQGNFRRLMLYAQAEAGSDLTSKTLFATTATRSNSFGLQYRAGRFWSISADGWNSRLLINLNPDTAALLAANGQLTSILANQRQWSAFVRVSRRFSWGGADYSRNDIARIAHGATPFTGALHGAVYVVHPWGERTPAAGVAVQLDSYRAVLSDRSGQYHFDEVPIGVHQVRVDPRRLPVDFADGDYPAQTVTVEQRKSAQADFPLQASATIQGTIEAPEGVRPSSVAIRVEPGARCTFADDDGKFRMDGLPEGRYAVTVGLVSGRESVAPVAEQIVMLRADEQTSLRFTLRRVVKELPVRLLQVGKSN